MFIPLYVLTEKQEPLQNDCFYLVWWQISVLLCTREARARRLWVWCQFWLHSEFKGQPGQLSETLSKNKTINSKPINTELNPHNWKMRYCTDINSTQKGADRLQSGSWVGLRLGFCIFFAKHRERKVDILSPTFFAPHLSLIKISPAR